MPIHSRYRVEAPAVSECLSLLEDDLHIPVFNLMGDTFSGSSRTTTPPQCCEECLSSDGWGIRPSVVDAQLDAESPQALAIIVLFGGDACQHVLGLAVEVLISVILVGCKNRLKRIILWIFAVPAAPITQLLVVKGKDRIVKERCKSMILETEIRT